MYVLVENNAIKKFPYSAKELIADNPQTSFPEQVTDELLETFNVFKVEGTIAPSYDDLSQDRNHGGIVFENGMWKEVWLITEASEVEKAARRAEKEKNLSEAARAQRNRALEETDWTQLADVPEQTKAAYLQYRQALRDVPTQADFPWAIRWPEKP